MTHGLLEKTFWKNMQRVVSVSPYFIKNKNNIMVNWMNKIKMSDYQTIQGKYMLREKGA